MVTFVGNGLFDGAFPEFLACVSVEAQDIKAIKAIRWIGFCFKAFVACGEFLGFCFFFGFGGGENNDLIADDDRRRAAWTGKFHLPEDVGFVIPFERRFGILWCDPVCCRPPPGGPIACGQVRIGEGKRP